MPHEMSAIITRTLLFAPSRGFRWLTFHFRGCVTGCFLLALSCVLGGWGFVCLLTEPN